MIDTREKTLLVIGGSSDVGLKLIEEVQGSYSTVIAHCNSAPERFNSIVRTGSLVIPVQADLSDVRGARKLVDECESICGHPSHIVHLAAPKARNLQFKKCNWIDFENGINISLRSAVEVLRAFVPAMAKDAYGRVVIMLTSYTFGVPPLYQAPYVTTKHAMLGLMKSLAAEYAGKGVTINGVSPDMMETRFLSDVPDKIVEMSAAKSPRGRNIDVDEAVAAIVFLLSDRASGITGQNLAITGGAR